MKGTDVTLRSQDEETGQPGPERGDREVVAGAIARIGDPDRARARARIIAGMEPRWSDKVKPVGSLGELEAIATRIAAVNETTEPGLARSAVVICAADHGLAAETVSAYPSEVTGLMVESAVAGGAGVSVLARSVGARVVLADLGVNVAPPSTGAQVLDRRIAAGTANSALGPAMSADQAYQAIRYGIDIAADLAGEGINLVILGEMGIGNTATAAALTAALLGLPADQVAGPGSGMHGERLAHKKAVVQRVLDRHAGLTEPLDVLAAMGGFEIAALTGVALGCAARKVAVVVDGFITGAAALVAARLAPAVTESMIAGHCSAEPGHRLQLDALGLRPVVDLGMRLGEGTGGLVAAGIIAAALELLDQMATYTSLGLGSQ